jgi:hypothetical protein
MRRGGQAWKRLALAPTARGIEPSLRVPSIEF